MEESVAKRLVFLRKSKKYSQYELGKKLGMSRSKISNIEQGRRGVNLEDAIEICDYFEICLERFVCPEIINYKKIISMIDSYLMTDVCDTKEESFLKDVALLYETRKNILAQKELEKLEKERRERMIKMRQKLRNRR